MAHICRVCPAMIRRYESGMTLIQTAVAVGASLSSVRQWLLFHGIALRDDRYNRRPMVHTCTDRCRAITDAYQGGASLEAVGLQHNLTRERIRQILRAHSVTVRRVGGTITKHHQCDDLCAAILADPQPSVTRLADRLNVSWYLINGRMRVHRVASVKPSHECSDRCRAVIAHLQTHLQDTAYTTGGKLGIPASWMHNSFRRNHPDLWRVRPYVVKDGRRVRV